MRRQKLVLFKNINVINELLDLGWSFDHTVEVGKTKYALLSIFINEPNTFENPNRVGIRGTLQGGY